MVLRQRLVGGMMTKLVAQKEAVHPVEGARCPTCKQTMEDRGRRTRTVRGPEGPVELERSYYYCPSCKEGIFPPGQGTEADSSSLDRER